jgi:hypothetical protein
MAGRCGRKLLRLAAPGGDPHDRVLRREPIDSTSGPAPTGDRVDDDQRGERHAAIVRLASSRTSR